jgi:hypothetical protein
MSALEMAATKEEGIFAAVQSGTRGTANPITNLVACDGTKHDWQQKPLEGDYARVGEDSGCNQKRVARKEKPYEKAGFDKNDNTDERSAPGAD